MTDLEKARKAINEIDVEIAALFERRMDAAKLVASHKKKFGLPIFDEAREKEICNKELEYIKNPDYKTYYLEMIHSIMDISKKYQSVLGSGSRVAYCGIEGAFANIAAKRIFPNGNMVAFSSFEKAYKAVELGDCDFAVLPIENSFAGDVTKVFDLMYSGSLFVNGIYNLHICQTLLGVKGAKISDVKTVVSHEQAIEQCGEYIQNHGFEVQIAVNTAMAARNVAQMGDVSVAAIGSKESAELYGLEVLEENINQNDLNTTKFAVLSRVYDDSADVSAADGFLLMFTVNNAPGALAKAIKIIGDNGFNLKSLRSRPVKNVPWKYYFYVEGEGALSSQKGDALVNGLKEQCEEVKLLGHFKNLEI